MKLREVRNKRNNGLAEVDNSSGRPTKFGVHNGKGFFWGMRWGYLQKVDRKTRRVIVYTIVATYTPYYH